MGIGRVPERGLPAETIYDRIVTERRPYRRLAGCGFDPFP